MDFARFGRSAVRRLATRVEPTISEGWDSWARRHKRRNPGTPLGNEWNEPAKVGADVAPEELVSHLDKTVFAPLIGSQETILEIGPGGGRFTEILLPKCRRLFAVETSKTMLELLAERFSGSSKITYLLTDGKTLGQEIPDGSVNAVFSYDVFVHLQHWDIFLYLTEIKRLLAPGGRAIIHHANTFSALGWDKFLKDMEPSIGHHKLPWTFSVMTPELMRNFAEKAGLTYEQTIVDVVRRDGITCLRA
jgi:ubiquinone/menaquinone biosynthesis C-methylase UbiE